VNLTQSEGTELQPAYSPDGKLIAFRSSLNGGGVLMNNDGTEVNNSLTPALSCVVAGRQ
jgi:Tol biopolymer transport system component